ncbi:uncharacterized protein BJ171DRAFT_503323 [Polychytrium aggregatum]|uniref:uncharacterized protein n=1 Tax=Polychytrium aggregatum TaxID=110093 RepID=UPI0022FEE35D|nr:uncharacterized protein BJ171DRAFT_503323 [Polychytrium aggregatum]KAI9205219.1 hypothetical protein BJ171DRAFT_503323 [Polychytrium aggregatum]
MSQNQRINPIAPCLFVLDSGQTCPGRRLVDSQYCNVHSKAGNSDCPYPTTKSGGTATCSKPCVPGYDGCVFHRVYPLDPRDPRCWAMKKNTQYKERCQVIPRIEGSYFCQRHHDALSYKLHPDAPPTIPGPDGPVRKPADKFRPFGGPITPARPLMRPTPSTYPRVSTSAHNTPSQRNGADRFQSQNSYSSIAAQGNVKKEETSLDDDAADDADAADDSVMDELISIFRDSMKLAKTKAPFDAERFQTAFAVTIHEETLKANLRKSRKSLGN